MSDAAIYAAITKADEQPDGTLIVRGIATDPSLDSDEQRCDPLWLKSAMPAWFRFGNIREQHGHVAAGVATEYVVDDEDRHEIAAHVVDAGSVAKVKAGVLKGFSIGIRNARIRSDKSAPGGIIQDGEIVEISLVDRPANPGCLLTLAKSARPGMQVRTGDYDKDTRLVKVEEYREVEAADKVAAADVMKTLTVEDLADAPVVPDPPAELVDAPPAPVDVVDAPAVDEAPETPAEVASVAADAGTDSGAPDASVVPVGEGEGDGGAGAPENTQEAAEPEGVPVLIGEAGPEIPELPRVASIEDEIARRTAFAGATAPVEPVPAPDAAPAVDAPEAPAEPSEKTATPDAKTVTVPLVIQGDDLREMVAKAVAELLGKTAAPKALTVPVVPEAGALLKSAGVGDVAAAVEHLAARGVTVTVPDVAKAEGVPTHDVETLRQVRNGLLSLIIAEAQEALAGEDETQDMRMLLDSLSIFLSWWCVETYHGEAPPSMDVKATDADVTKTAEPTTPDAGDAASTETPTPDEGEGSTTSKTAQPETVKAPDAEADQTAVLTKALDTLRAENAALTARVEQLAKAAAPGGPIRTRPTAAVQKSREGDALRIKAAEYRALAKTVSPVDVAREYERLAAEAETKLRALTAEPA